MMRYLLMGILSVFVLSVQAQGDKAIIQQKKVIKTRIIKLRPKGKNKTNKLKTTEVGDTVLLSQKTSNYDSLGRMLNEQQYFYGQREERLIKEEKNSFDAKTQVLSQYITEYPTNKEPKTKKMETKYLTYKADISQNKYIWRKLYDDIGEIIKEDTLTYDNQQELIEKSTYDYRGSTSLFRDYYSFNKKNQQKRWRMFSIWTTIDGRGEVAERKAKRRDYRYCYNNKGMLKKAWGKHYSTRFVQKIKYDKEGRILEDKTVKRRKTQKQKELDSGKKKMVRFVQKETLLIQYEKGLKVLESRTIGANEYSREELSYKDSLLISKKRYLRAKVLEEVTWTYSPEGLLQKKKVQKYNTNGQPRSYTIVSYDNSKQAIKEELYIQDKVYKTTKRKFDINGNLLEETLSTTNNPSFEKTMYIYKYY